jgi:hypothetical protein
VFPPAKFSISMSPRDRLSVGRLTTIWSWQPGVEGQGRRVVRLGFEDDLVDGFSGWMIGRQGRDELPSRPAVRRETDNDLVLAATHLLRLSLSVMLRPPNTYRLLAPGTLSAYSALPSSLASAVSVRPAGPVSMSPRDRLSVGRLTTIWSWQPPIYCACRSRSCCDTKPILA